MQYSEIKKLIKHLRTGRWAEVILSNFDGWWDVTCVQHLKDVRFNSIYPTPAKITVWRAL